MTVNDTLAAIEVMKAFTEGKQIECRLKGVSGAPWDSISNCDTPAWQWDVVDYRVKPGPPTPTYTIRHKTRHTLFNPTWMSLETARKGISDTVEGDAEWEVVMLVPVPS